MLKTALVSTPIQMNILSIVVSHGGGQITDNDGNIIGVGRTVNGVSTKYASMSTPWTNVFSYEPWGFWSIIIGC